jgi:hypothetical protein
MVDTDANIPAGANQVKDAKEDVQEEAQEEDVQEDTSKVGGNEDDDPYDVALMLCGIELQHSHQAITAQGFVTLSEEVIMEFVKAHNELKVLVSKQVCSCCSIQFNQEVPGHEELGQGMSPLWMSN